MRNVNESAVRAAVLMLSGEKLRILHGAVRVRAAELGLEMTSGLGSESVPDTPPFDDRAICRWVESVEWPSGGDPQHIADAKERQVRFLQDLWSTLERRFS